MGDGIRIYVNSNGLRLYVLGVCVNEKLESKKTDSNTHVAWPGAKNKEPIDNRQECFSCSTKFSSGFYGWFDGANNGYVKKIFCGERCYDEYRDSGHEQRNWEVKEIEKQKAIEGSKLSLQAYIKEWAELQQILADQKQARKDRSEDRLKEMEAAIAKNNKEAAAKFAQQKAINKLSKDEHKMSVLK